MSENSGHSEERFDYERRDAHGMQLFVIVVVSVIILTAAVLWLNAHFIGEKEKLMFRVAHSPVSKQLRELRAREAEILTSYGWVDSSKGIVRIPIERAMELTARESFSGE